MNENEWNRVDRYLEEMLLPPDPALDLAIARSAAAGLPPIQVAANQGKSQGSAQWQKMISDIQKAGISRIVSNSLWIDVTPK